jgi:ribosomal protein S18 acetylase RimI-like enzyme
MFERTYEGEKIIVAVNINGNNESVNIGENLTDLLTGESFGPGAVTLLPHSARILSPAPVPVSAPVPASAPVAAEIPKAEEKNITVRAYLNTDEAKLFGLMRDEGHEWQEYWGGGADRYKQAIAASFVFVACDEDKIVGYVRAKDDNGFGVYIYDLLVAKPYRGRSIGRKLMERVKLGFPGNIVYVMSDVDGYYQKQGYERHGSIFEVK